MRISYDAKNVTEVTVFDLVEAVANKKKAIFISVAESLPDSKYDYIGEIDLTSFNSYEAALVHAKQLRKQLLTDGYLDLSTDNHFILL